MRLATGVSAIALPGFNPRICKRCDQPLPSQPSMKMVSIHASVKDATLCVFMILIMRCFNPRICKRCDSILLTLAYIVTSFNPRICKRCDNTHIRARSCHRRFNPRICKRCDTLFTFRSAPSDLFQSTHL